MEGDAQLVNLERLGSAREEEVVGHVVLRRRVAHVRHHLRTCGISGVRALPAVGCGSLRDGIRRGGGSVTWSRTPRPASKLGTAMQAVMTEVKVHTLGRTRLCSMSCSMLSAVGRSSALPTASISEVNVLTVGSCVRARSRRAKGVRVRSARRVRAVGSKDCKDRRASEPPYQARSPHLIKALEGRVDLARLAQSVDGDLRPRTNTRMRVRGRALAATASLWSRQH